MTGASKTSPNLTANVACVTDPAKSAKEGALPTDIQSDLLHAFNYFAREDTHINRSDFESIIHNFGFSYISQRDRDVEL